jgi:hypothetical protein
MSAADAWVQLDWHQPADIAESLAGSAAVGIGIHDDREMGAYIGPEPGIQRKELPQQQGSGMDEDDRSTRAHIVEDDDGNAGDAR